MRGGLLVPVHFRTELVPAIWNRAVIIGFGYPFVNFTSPSVATLIRGTDPKKVKEAYKRVKTMFKQCGLKKPVETLKEFAHTQYRDCSLNALSVDADDLLAAQPGMQVGTNIINPYSKGLSYKGSAAVPFEFLTTFYKILSPVTGKKQYCELCSMSPADYDNYLATNMKPPVYILTPNKGLFRRGPKPSILHRLFGNKGKPVLVRTRVSGHDGGFLIPETIADRIFTE